MFGNIIDAADSNIIFHGVCGKPGYDVQLFCYRQSFRRIIDMKIVTSYCIEDHSRQLARRWRRPRKSRVEHRHVPKGCSTVRKGNLAWE